MSDIIDKLNSQIDADKEVLSVLPKNNKKNVKAYQDKAEAIKQEYASFLNDVSAEIKRRNVKINSISLNPKIPELSTEIEEMEDIRLVDNNATPFEKMKLDETLYILKRFYKNNLELVNNSILNCIEIFKKVGVELEAKDFNYSIYTKEYMETFLEETKKGDMNSQKVKDTFEQIYWKCSDIILHIELNFRSLYYKNEKTITSHFESESKRILKQVGLSKEEALKKLDSMKLKLQDLMNKDTSLILDKFKSGERFTKDYEPSNIQKYYKKLIGCTTDEVEKHILDEYNQNIEKLSYSLNEYKNYLKFKFIFDEVMAIYNDKQKYKKVYNDKMKQIQKLEGKLFKGNKKIEKYSKHKGLISKLFSGKNQKKLDKINIDSNSQILELKTIYRELEDNKVNNIIAENLNEASTIYDVLLLISVFYSFLVKVIIKQYEDMDQEQIAAMITEFRQFVNFSNTTVLNNIKIAEDKDIALVIKDKYNLCNINLEKGDFSEENIENIIATANNICEYNYIINSRLGLEDIKFVMESDKILEREKQ
ncbi:MAG: hypothetical protein IKP28_05595 [Clostridia bacterium]|nr:hypothetical protein [Clostridia bacterium]